MQFMYGIEEDDLLQILKPLWSADSRRFHFRGDGDVETITIYYYINGEKKELILNYDEYREIVNARDGRGYFFGVMTWTGPWPKQENL